MCQQEFQTEVMDEERRLDEPVEPDLGDAIFAMMVAMSCAAVEELQASQGKRHE